jgi:dipeptidyl aminopeptidase/acylaminoacyl peptidase
MRQSVRWLVASAIVVLPVVCARIAVGASAGTYAAPPLSLYGQLPSIANPALSPAGDRLACIERQADGRYIVVFDVANLKVVATALLGDTKVRALSWYDDDQLLILYSATAYPPYGLFGPRAEWFMLGTWDTAKSRARSIDLHADSYETMNVLSAAPEVRVVNGETELFVSGIYLNDRQLSPGLFSIDLQGNRTRLIGRGDNQEEQWVVDAQGHIAASFGYQVRGPDQGTWTLRLRRGDEMRQVASGTASYDPPHIIGFSYDDKSLLVAFDTPDGWIWKPLELADGTWGAPLGAGKTFFDVIRNRLTGQVIGGVQDRLAPRQLFFDPALQLRWSAVLGVYSGERVQLVSYSDDLTKFLIRVFGPRDGDTYLLIDWRTVDLYPVGKVYGGLSTFAEVQRIDYKAADGLAIAGFLTLPPGAPANELSLVVMPHGGPAATDDGDFDWWAQALASRGYAVLQVNYRGSDTTPALLRAGYGEWGRKMQTDLSDGVRYLIERGVVDPKRVCIVGASYGGYAALAGVTLQTGIYRCAVSVAGVADLAAILRWTSARMMTSRNEFTQYWDHFLGVSGPSDPRLAAISPIDHVDAVTVPILLIHGRDDTVVPYAQSEEMAKALRRAGKSVQFISLPNEDHWLSHNTTREQMLDAVVSFLERNDPPSSGSR